VKSRRRRRRGSASTSPQAAASPSKRFGESRTCILCAGVFLALLVGLSYGNSLQNGFTWDDNQQILMNPGLRSGASVWRLLTSGVWAFSHESVASHNDYYRPLQTLTYRAVESFHGFDPAVFHAVSIVFGMIAAILAFALFWKLARRPVLAFAAATLFAVHPVHTEAIDWVSALPELGCTIFLLASLLFFLKVAAWPAAHEPRPRRFRRDFPLWTLSLACFAAALLWKETAGVLPLLIAALVFLNPSENRPLLESAKAAALRSLPFWIVLGPYLLLRFRALGFVATRLRDWQLTPFQVALTLPHLMMSYWWKLLLPVPLSAYYSFSPLRSILEVGAATGIFSFALALAFIVYAARRRPLLAFSALWVFVTLLPVMDIYAVGRNVFAERYLYFPSVGFCLFAALLGFEAISRIPRKFRTPVALAAIVAIVVSFAAETVARNPYWKDDRTLFARTLQTSPDAPFVLNMVASEESAESSTFSAAEGHYSRAAALASREVPPDRLQAVRAYEGLAWIYSERSDFRRALGALGRVRRLDPADPEVDGEEGLILTKAERWHEAAAYLRRAVASSYADENVLNALGLFCLHHTGDLDQAAGYFRRALAIHTAQDAFSASLHNNLGTVYGEQGRYSDAVPQFQEAIAAAPKDPQYHTNLATAFAARGRYTNARLEIRAALAIAPGFGPAEALAREIDDRPSP
jgi:protein O-mannosyl-transferase